MKIQNTSVNPLSTQKPEGAKPVDKQSRVENEATEVASRDRAELSERAKAMAKARQVSEATPDTRADQVNALRIQVENGTYQVPLGELAKRMMSKLDFLK